ncbi:MAG: hypothetical protein H6553_05715 [Chitinophagales bacterium]|nr:hypothetical protein [Chitinophagales bacterium]
MNFKTITEQSIAICHEDVAFFEYSSREKTLAFYFTFIQQINQYAEQFKPIFSKNLFLIFLDDDVKQLKTAYVDVMHPILEDALHTGEVQKRAFVEKSYIEVLWWSFIVVLQTWSKDASNQQEDTDVMIEKAVHFAYDSIAPNAFDSGFDLAKFLIQLNNK